MTPTAKTNSKNGGFSALLIIVVIASVMLIISLNASLLGLGELDLGYTSQKGGEAYAFADGCVEESLRRFSLDTNYTGETFIMGNNSCSIEVTKSGLYATSTVTASTTSAYYKTLETAFTFTDNVHPTITIISWTEKEE